MEGLLGREVARKQTSKAQDLRAGQVQTLAPAMS